MSSAHPCGDRTDRSRNKRLSHPAEIVVARHWAGQSEWGPGRPRDGLRSLCPVPLLEPHSPECPFGQKRLRSKRRLRGPTVWGAFKILQCLLLHYQSVVCNENRGDTVFLPLEPSTTPFN